MAITSTDLSFAQEPQYAGFAQPFQSHEQRFEGAIDLDLDGVPDLVGWWYRAGGKIRVLQLHRSPDTGHHWLWRSVVVDPHFDWPFSGDESSTALGDVDGDGRGDMVVTLRREVVVLLAREQSWAGQPYGLLTHTQSFPIEAGHVGASRDVILADFDGDGRDELVIAWGDEVRLYRSDANGVVRFQDSAPVVPGQPSSRPPSLEVGDFDGDDGLELAAFHPDLFRVAIFSPDGHTLGAPTVLRTELGQSGTQIASGDVDGDGDDDIVVFQEERWQTPPYFEVLRHGSTGECVPEDPRVGGPASDLVDLDGDGDLDGVCCGGSGGSGQPSNNTSSVFRVCVNDGTGVFSTAATYDGRGAHEFAAALDLDHDGDVDLVAGSGVLLNEAFMGTAFCAGHPNSTGVAGGLSVTGSVRGVSEPLTFEATGLPSNALSVVVYGWPSHPGSVPIGAGELCIIPTWLERGFLGSTDSSGTRTIDVPGGASSLPWSSSAYPGITMGFQVWHRDLPSHGGSNLTRGVAITFGGE